VLFLGGAGGATGSTGPTKSGPGPAVAGIFSCGQGALGAVFGRPGCAGRCFCRPGRAGRCFWPARVRWALFLAGQGALGAVFGGKEKREEDATCTRAGSGSAVGPSCGCALAAACWLCCGRCIPEVPPSLGLAALVAGGLTAVSHSTFPGPESPHLRWMMGACVAFADLCSNMQLTLCRFVCYLERIYLVASPTDFAEVEVGVRVYPV
jgi:hypothetical protein